MVRRLLREWPRPPGEVFQPGRLHHRSPMKRDNLKWQKPPRSPPTQLAAGLHSLSAVIWGRRKLRRECPKDRSSSQRARDGPSLRQRLAASLVLPESNGSCCSRACGLKEPSKLTLGPCHRTARVVCAPGTGCPQLSSAGIFFGLSDCPYCLFCTNFSSHSVFWPQILFSSCFYCVQHYINPCPSLRTEVLKHLVPF